MWQQEILIFDTETTGTDTSRDQIIEICLQRGVGDDAQVQVWRCRPRVPIHPAAQAVHGISMEDLRDSPEFGAIADEVRGWFQRAEVVVAYNARFDLEMLQAELQRIGQPAIDLSHAAIVDPFRLWQRCEPRSLMDAHRRFVGQEFDAAHSAAADVAATGRVLEGMVRDFTLGDKGWSGIADLIDPDRGSRIGTSHHLKFNDSGDIEVGFGKHRGRLVVEMANGPDAGYLRWILNKDFPAAVQEVCRQALDLSEASFRAWVSERYDR
tara:strand:+ start:119 stop:919 length:801 start_codon:yes stop_codon:yes gene_type:complete